MTVEGAMLQSKDRAVEAAAVLRDEVIRLERMLRLAGHAYKHNRPPSHEVLWWWHERIGLAGHDRTHIGKGQT